MKRQKREEERELTTGVEALGVVVIVATYLEPVNVGPMLASREHFDSCLRDEECVFKLCRLLAILCRRSPVVRPAHSVSSLSPWLHWAQACEPRVSQTSRKSSSSDRQYVPQHISPLSLIDHRLDCENVTWLHRSNGLVIRIVWYVGTGL